MDATSKECVEYIGGSSNNPESLEVLEFHSNLILYQIEALQQIEQYHRSFPWRLVECLDPTSWSAVLTDMKRVWEFTVGVADVLRPADALFYELQITRFQNFRDVMIKAECLGLMNFGYFLFGSLLYK